MDDALIYWDDRPGKCLDKITLRGLTTEEVEAVIRDESIPPEVSRKSGLPCKRGYAPTGRYVFVVREVLSDDPPVLAPVTAYTPDPE